MKKNPLKRDKLPDQRVAEYVIHKAVIDYINYAYPHALYSTDLGGVRLSIGSAKKVARLRKRKGFPDLFIYEPVGKYSGLAIELKTKSGSVSEDQTWWLKELEQRGYKVGIGRGFDNAKTLVDMYMRGMCG